MRSYGPLTVQRDGLVTPAPASSVAGPGFKSHLSHTGELKIGMQDAWHYGIRTRTGWPGIGLL